MEKTGRSQSTEGRGARRTSPLSPRVPTPRPTPDALAGVTPEQARAIRAIIANDTNPPTSMDVQAHTTPGPRQINFRLRSRSRSPRNRESARVASPAAAPTPQSDPLLELSSEQIRALRAIVAPTVTPSSNPAITRQETTNAVEQGRGRGAAAATQPFGRGAGSRRGNGRGTRWYYFGMYCPYPGQYSAYCTMHREKGCTMCIYFTPDN